MKESKLKITLFVIVSFIVISILLSNIGQNFKGNISSYDFTNKYLINLNKTSLKSKNYQSYINFSAGYISRFMRSNNFDTFSGNRYIEEWKVNVPSILYQSSLEVSKNGVLYKKYNYGTDFFEDFRGNLTTGIVKSVPDYAEDLSSIHDVLNQVLLFNGYKSSTTSGAISFLDEKLRLLGASGIISPISGNDFIESSGYNEEYKPGPKIYKGLAKLVTTRKVFDELQNFALDGCTVKLKSGGDIRPFTYKNIYCLIKGSNSKLKPLVISTFYDGLKKPLDKQFYISKNNQTSAAILMDCMRVLNKQRLRRPDRSIVFAFLSGHGKSDGLDHFEDMNPDSSIIYINGIGVSDSYNIYYGKSQKGFSISTSNLMKENTFYVNARKKDRSVRNNTIKIIANNLSSLREIEDPNYYKVANSSKFILSLIEDECYNVNLLTGNFRYVKQFEKNVRKNSAVLSIIAIALLAIAVFSPSKRHPKNQD